MDKICKNCDYEGNPSINKNCNYCGEELDIIVTKFNGYEGAISNYLVKKVVNIFEERNWEVSQAVSAGKSGEVKITATCYGHADNLWDVLCFLMKRENIVVSAIDDKSDRKFSGWFAEPNCLNDRYDKEMTKH